LTLAVTVLVAGCAAAPPSPDLSGQAAAPSPVSGGLPSGEAATPVRPTIRPSAPLESPSPPPRISLDLAVYALPELDGLLHGVAVSAVSGGPAGVVILGNDRATGALLSITSADGGGWIRHWLDGATFAGGTPDRLVGGPFGYLALGWKPEPGSAEQALWSSPDGVSWSPTPTVGLPAAEPSALVGTTFGAAIALDLGGAGAAVATTSDGAHWTVATPPTTALANVFSLVALPEGVLVIGPSVADQASGSAAIHAWTSADGSAWTESRAIGDAISALENSVDVWGVGPWGAVGGQLGGSIGVVTPDGFEKMTPPPVEMGALAMSPAGVVWFEGADQAATCASGWQYTGSEWQPLVGSRRDEACLTRAATYVVASATTPTGIVVMASEGDATDLAAWLVRPRDQPPLGAGPSGPATPPADAIPDALAARFDRPATCPAVPVALDDLAKIPARTAVACFGDRDLSFRAWIVDPGEGYGGTCPAFSPAWIQECVLPDFLLATARTTDTNGAVLHGMRSPSATGATTGVGRWVRVTGHYDDPVSSSCRGVTSDWGLGLASEIPPALAVSMCRQVFVVSNVRNLP
jgi:hypothetical protein